MSFTGVPGFVHPTQDQEFPFRWLVTVWGHPWLTSATSSSWGAGKPLGLQNSLEFGQELSQGLFGWRQLILRNALILIIAFILINAVDFEKCINSDKLS